MDSMITIHGERLRIHYTLEGKGTPLILLHGWGQNLEMMKFIADYFQRRFQVLNLDLPGFGESEEPYHAWSLDDYVLFIHEICVKRVITSDYYEFAKQQIFVASLKRKYVYFIFLLFINLSYLNMQGVLMIELVQGLYETLSQNKTRKSTPICLSILRHLKLAMLWAALRRHS